MPNAEGARVEAPRRAGFGEGVSPSPMWEGSEKGAVPSGDGAVPPPQNRLIFELKMVRYGAFWCYFRGEIGRCCI